MKHFAVCLVVACGIAFTGGTVNAAIRFGSRQAAIETTDGTFDFTNNVTLSKGTLRTLGSGSFTNDASEYLDCSKMKVQTKYDVTTKGMHVDGKLYLNDDTLTLENNDHLILSGGQITQNVSVNGADATPSIIQGYGSFDGAITISNGKELVSRWGGQLNQDITIDASGSTTKLTLENDLVFSNGFSTQGGSSGTSTVNFGGYTMQVGGVTIGANAQTWDTAHLVLNGDTAISADITLTSSAGVFNGNGYKMTMSGGFLGSVGGSINNTFIAGYDENTFGGSGTWNLGNTILDDGTNKIRVISGAVSGGTADLFANADSASNTVFPSEMRMELLSDITLGSEWLSQAALHINGNGYAIKCIDSTGTFDFNNALYLDDVTLTNVTAATLESTSGQTIFCKNVTWHDGSGDGSLFITASPYYETFVHARLKVPNTANAGNLLSGSTSLWASGFRIDLLSNATFAGTWRVTQKAALNGKGYTFEMQSGSLDYEADLYLSDIVLGNVAAGSFDNTANADLYLNNVTWVDDSTEGIMRITGNTEDTTVAAAQVELATSNSGNLFSTAVNWKNGTSIELLKGITFSTGAAWTFTKSSVINGNGNFIDLNSVSGTDPITVASGQTLKITDAVIKGWGNSDIAFTGATLELANVTIVLDSNVALGATEDIVINGAVRFVTGSNEFDASLADSDNYINGVTVWYDTLGTLDQSNLNFGSFSGGGRTAMMPLSEWADITFDSSSSHVHRTMHLLYDINVFSDSLYEALGRQVTFDNTFAFTLKGNGRTFYMGKIPASADTNKVGNQLITVSGSTNKIVEVHDVIFDGWKQEHITDTNDLIRYGDGTVIKLQEDEAVSKTIQFAHNNAGESIVLDLNGNVLDLASDAASLTITDIDATLTIKNGRLLNVGDQTGGDPKLHALGTTATLVFQDIDLVLAGDTTLTASNVQFKGDCTVTGTGSYELKCYHTPITITDGARVSFGKGITLGLYGNGTSTDASISFGSNNSTLAFNRSTFDTSNLVLAPTLTHGTLRIDDLVTFAGDMTLGSSTAVLDLDIDLMPAASIEVSSGTITYANAS